MSYCLHSESHLDTGPIYVRENGKLHVVNQGSGGIRDVTPKTRPFRLFSRGFSVELCMNREDDRARRQRTDHFIFTYTKEGNLRYSAKSLFSLVLGYISDNVDHIDSLIGFPEQIAEKLFSAAEARQKFTEPVTGLRALQKFTEAYGNLVLCSLCLRNSVKQLLLKDNSLSDAGLRRMTAPVRVLKKGLENLLVLDLSCNPKITDVGIGYLLSFKKLNCLDISGTGLKDVNAVIKRLQTQIGLVHSKVPLKEFDHSNCKTEGWAEQTVLQWEQAAMEAIKPRDNLRSRTAALRFYGKTHRIEEVVKCKLVEAETKASGNLQFYKEKVPNCHLPLKKEVVGSHELKNNKKRALTEQERERTSKQKHLCLTVEDWDLLNTY
ncbi:PREDICTED: leucine-rich repeat-containing protein 42 isoform X2 [Nestor notabilis]|uniref:leucine-rich repeat-containing protein 42 isoform X2 n=1 Tax=Nestor notabilis TaxID=176057 RepID=UPI00052335B1|nr:PREDICTED: leucine-rich repeat-containing protein 42 isoform X2 [Nestor notabilis]